MTLVLSRGQSIIVYKKQVIPSFSETFRPRLKHQL